MALKPFALGLGATIGARMRALNRAARVLIVEDDDAVRELIAMLLSDEGYLVQEAVDGRTALAIASAWRPDLLLLDLLLPDGSGMDVLAECRTRGLGRGLALFVSGSGGNRAAAAFSIAPVLTKPFDLDELLDLVRSLIQ